MSSETERLVEKTQQSQAACRPTTFTSRPRGIPEQEEERLADDPARERQRPPLRAFYCFRPAFLSRPMHGRSRVRHSRFPYNNRLRRPDDGLQSFRHC